jgi:hypothetical protein
MPSCSRREINGLRGTVFAKMQNNLQKCKIKAAYLHKENSVHQRFYGQNCVLPGKKRTAQRLARVLLPIGLLPVFHPALPPGSLRKMR